MPISESNEFLLLMTDLSKALGISLQALHKFARTKGFDPTLINNRAYLSPEAVREVLVSRGFSYKRQILSIQMLKGGVAKTTTAMNIGIRANMYGSRVLLIDLDQQANLSFALGVEDPDAFVWVDILEGKATIQQAIRSISPFLDLIPSNLNNSILDRILLSGKRNIASGISQFLTPIQEKYDLVIIDTAPNLSAINTAAACVSDIVILPVNPDKFSFAGLKKTLEDLDKIAVEFKSDFIPRILFTKFDGRETSSHELLKLCFANFSEKMMKAFVRTSTEVKNTIRTGRTVFDNKSTAKDDYDLVTRELIGLAN